MSIYNSFLSYCLIISLYRKKIYYIVYCFFLFSIYSYIINFSLYMFFFFYIVFSINLNLSILYIVYLLYSWNARVCIIYIYVYLYCIFQVIYSFQFVLFHRVVFFLRLVPYNIHIIFYVSKDFCFIIRWFGDICKKKKRETNILFF